MAYLALSSLLKTAQPDYETPAEITGMPVKQTITAMRVGYGEKDKQLVYLGEQGPLDWLWLARDIEDGQSNRYRWWRFEVIADNKNCPVIAGDDLVVADYPYASLQVHQAPFKKGTVHRKDVLSALTFDSVKSAQDWIDEQKQDYFYTSRGAIAAISEPAGMLNPDSQRNPPRNEAGVVFGVCENMEQFKRVLSASEEVKKLFYLTKTRIMLGPREHYPNPIELPDEVVDEGNALMYMSICQALAGPYAKSDEWLGKPVTDRIDQLYRDHLFNRWQRYLTDQRRRSDRDIDE